MKIKEILSKVLMAVVLISIGFAAGKEMALRSTAQNAEAVSQAAMVDHSAEPSDAHEEKVLVYYMHATFRCFSCNNIEKMAKAVVENDFADALAEGQVEWQAVNFNENTVLAQRYGVGAATVVLVRRQGGQEIAFKRLDEVWTKLGDADAFKQYVKENIQSYLYGGRV